jgi:putative ABC transport system ATP-binding protein
MLVLERIVRRFYSGGDEVRALDGISLDVAAGSFVTIVGSNGAGKSTLLKTICGLVAPDAGRVVLDGRDVTRWPVHRRGTLIGRIAQDPQEGTCASMTIGENLAMAALRGQKRGLGGGVTEARAARFREELAGIGLGLENRLGTRVGTLSGGQRQALSLLMATSGAPKLLLLDEHLANLDPRISGIVMDYTARRIAASGVTTMMVTHNMEEAIRWGDRLLMLHAGRVIFEAAGAEKSALTVPGLVARFHEASHATLADDRLLLSP